MTDLALGLLRHGYRAIEAERNARGGGDTYVTRLLGRRTVVVGGEHGARLFYDESVVRRRGAVPMPLRHLLFGRGAVHGLDDEAHRGRKALHLSILGAGQTRSVALDAGWRLEASVPEWKGREVAVHDALVTAYGGAVLQWAGVRLPEDEARRTSRELARMVDGFGLAGAAYARAWVARLRMNRWGRDLVEAVRSGRAEAPEGSPLAVIAASDLDPLTASVELDNLVRPTVATSWLGTFAVLALDGAPEWRERLASGPAADRVAFAQEVRRTAPFVPALAGRVRRAVEHDGVTLRAGDRIVLDVPGIDQDPRHWPHPHLFRPERFLDREPGPYEMVPQGGGPVTGHRCPGESLVVQLLAETLRVLAGVDFRVVSPRQVDLSRIPTLPAGGLRVAVAG